MMKNDDDNLGLMAVMLEVGVVIAICLIILARMPKDEGQKEVPSVTATPTMAAAPTDVPTVTPTITPTITPTAMPTKEFTAYRAYSPKTCTIKEAEPGHEYKPLTWYTSYDVPGSAQARLQKVAKTAENGIRVVTDPEGFERYCVALGTYWAGAHPEHIGRCVDVVMENGTVLRCVLADVKQTKDTKNQQNKYGKGNNDILEFICDKSVLREGILNCSKISAEFEGGVKRMIVWDMWIEGFGSR